MIKETDLLKSPNGGAYHLGLQPDQVADTIITVGDPDRVGLFSKFFDQVEHQVQQREFAAHTGWFSGRRLTVISTGIGTDNIDIVINELDALVNTDWATREYLPQQKSLRIIRVGTSGAIQANLDPGTISFATHALGFDNLMHFYDYDPVGKLGLLMSDVADYFDARSELMVLPYLTQAGQEIVVDRIPKNWVPGITATMPGFYAPQGRQVRAKQAEPKLLELLQKLRIDRMPITNIEMETSAIYGLSHLLGHQALSISVLLANRATDVWHENTSAAVENLIGEVMEWIAL
jgi:uridine phosphorylase